MVCREATRSAESLAQAELALGVSLPQSLRWILAHHGYWHGTAVSSLQEAIANTLLAREHHHLPLHYVVLNNYEDGGLILIDTASESTPGESPLYWIGMEDLDDPPCLEGAHHFPSYGAFAVYMLPSTKDIIPSDLVAYDPSTYPEGQRGGA